MLTLKIKILCSAVLEGTACLDSDYPRFYKQWYNFTVHKCSLQFIERKPSVKFNGDIDFIRYLLHSFLNICFSKVLFFVTWPCDISYEMSLARIRIASIAIPIVIVKRPIVYRNVWLAKSGFSFFLNAKLAGRMCSLDMKAKNWLKLEWRAKKWVQNYDHHVVEECIIKMANLDLHFSAEYRISSVNLQLRPKTKKIWCYRQMMYCRKTGKKWVLCYQKILKSKSK